MGLDSETVFIQQPSSLGDLQVLISFAYEPAWTISVLAASVSTAISTAEQVAVYKQLFSSRGLIAEGVLETKTSVRGHWLKTSLGSAGSVKSTLTARFLLALTVLFTFCTQRFSISVFSTIEILILILTILAANVKTRCYGQEGSDQLVLITLICYWIYCLMRHGTLAYYMPGVFLVGQIILSYLAAGISKLVSSTWRNGDAIAQINGLIDFKLQGFSSPNRVMRLLAAWGVMLFEVSFPLALASKEMCYVVLTIGLIFHLAVACIMGFNRFLTAYIGVYPMVIWAAGAIHNH